jgi:hypothetical protein
MIGIENCMNGGSVIRGGSKGMSTATSGLPSMGLQKKDEYHEATFMNNKYVFSNGEKELTAEVEILPEPGGDPDSIGVYTKTTVTNVTEDELEERGRHTRIGSQTSITLIGKLRYRAGSVY